MTEHFYFAHLKATYCGWVIYRSGEFFAGHFASKPEAMAYAKEFCELNGYRYSESK